MQSGLNLHGPLYSKVLRRVQGARCTGHATSITLIQQPVCFVKNVCPPMVYHVALLGEAEGDRRIFEHGPVRYDVARAVGDSDVLVALPSVRRTLDDIAAFEATLPTQYVIGVRDCRHHVLDLLDFLYY